MTYFGLTGWFPKEVLRFYCRRCSPTHIYITEPGVLPQESAIHVERVRYLSLMENDHLYERWRTHRETFCCAGGTVLTNGTCCAGNATPVRSDYKDTSGGTNEFDSMITTLAVVPLDRL